MERTAVKSSQIASIGYDPDTKTLEIEFHRRNPDDPPSLYRYAAVPAEIHANFMGAPSQSVYLGAVIKPAYPCTKLEPTSGQFMPLEQFPASQKSKDALLAMAKRALLCSGEASDYIGPLWREVVAAAGLAYEDACRMTCLAWINSLNQVQCSAAVDALKRKR